MDNRPDPIELEALTALSPAELEARLDALALAIATERKPAARRLLTARRKRLEDAIKSRLGALERVRIARNPARPQTLDYVEALITDFFELHGDRRYGDDGAIVAGLGYFKRTPVAVVGHQRGRSTNERLRRNFGKPHPEGYRKAARLFDLASRFQLPVITFIDTQGAEPGVGAEERGQSEAIAVNLELMARIAAPVIACVIGEGGSGGALALGVGNVILMQEYACYSVITPEGCAAILWREGGPEKIAEAARALKLTAEDLLRLGVIDEIVPEPPGGAHREPPQAIVALGAAIARHLATLVSLAPAELRRRRERKFAAMGTAFVTDGAPARIENGGAIG
ncbi:MAG TPA: acetyl-CoA carboxylase carboxyltransferase subunit alpha [Candidatus Binataceae bacterium]|nr:acetyl-CoA carboxylase carboxyltransferase subunit alpha [Candidatus Binataceae bacterium]HVC44482.1 acetyl-CoA carboxylase carboxyltransferase subunit alpha [Candidatus Binataceae bacterium]